MWLLDKLLTRVIRAGELTVIDADGNTHRYGTPHPDHGPVTIRLTDRRVARDISRNPRLGAGEAFMDGRLVIEQGDVMDFIDLVTWNGRWERGGDSRHAIDRGWSGKLKGVIGLVNWQRKSKRNVAHHYDLNDRLYDLFLDADRQYSCAYFTDPANSLEQAQADKKAHIAAKLDLRPHHKVLDIGCGWGGMALYINARTGASVHGITLSEEQLKVAQRRAQEAGVADRVTFSLTDYRDVEGKYDRIVSVGMFEHVGPPQYRTFFAKCRSLLTDDGVMLLHTIGRMGRPGSTDPWTAKYIFPGGYNPALSQIVTATHGTKLIISDIETLRLHYALTLQHWYKRTVAARDAIVALYDERFYRMWTFYLAGACCAFRHGGLVNYQIQLIRRRDTLPITRDYIHDAELALGQPAPLREEMPAP
jgi:cyclopropane-fatty-acyl-phospholipid synthase